MHTRRRKSRESGERKRILLGEVLVLIEEIYHSTMQRSRIRRHSEHCERVREGGLYETVRSSGSNCHQSFLIRVSHSRRGVSEAQAVDAVGKIYTFGSYRQVFLVYLRAVYRI